MLNLISREYEGHGVIFYAVLLWAFQIYIPLSIRSMRRFLHTGQGYLIFNVDSYPGYHERVLHWMYLNSRAWSPSDASVVSKLRHHVILHLSVFRDFWKLILNLKASGQQEKNP